MSYVVYLSLWDSRCNVKYCNPGAYSFISCQVPAILLLHLLASFQIIINAGTVAYKDTKRTARPKTANRLPFFAQ